MKPGVKAQSLNPFAKPALFTLKRLKLNESHRDTDIDALGHFSDCVLLTK